MHIPYTNYSKQTKIQKHFQYETLSVRIYVQFSEIENGYLSYLLIHILLEIPPQGKAGPAGALEVDSEFIYFSFWGAFLTQSLFTLNLNISQINLRISLSLRTVTEKNTTGHLCSSEGSWTKAAGARS